MKFKLLLRVILEGIFLVVLRVITPLIDNRMTKSLGFIYRRSFWKIKLKSLGSDAFFYPNVVIHNPDKVTIGNDCAIAEFVHIWGGCGVTIGDNVMIASGVSITSLAHSPEESIMKNSLVLKPVIVEENVWIGTHAVILPGVIIECGSVVAAGAVVTKNVPRDVIVVGVPARIMKHINKVVK